ncbi:MAG: hypothetical protein H6Q20_465 [Bacteroidetes bacterium]|nr:hypothetical protein [Bacteroidota bacterium]
MLSIIVCRLKNLNLFNRKPLPERIIREQTKIQSAQKVQIVYSTMSELSINIQLLYIATKIEKITQQIKNIRNIFKYLFSTSFLVQHKNSFPFKCGYYQQACHALLHVCFEYIFLFSDTKLSKNISENFVVRNLTCNFAQKVHTLAYVLTEKIT